MSTRRRHLLQLAWGLGASASIDAWSRGPSPTLPTHVLHWHETALLAFGTTVWLRAAHEHAAQARRGVSAAAHAVQRVDQQMSLFRPDSEIVRLNRDGVLHHPSTELVDVLRLSQTVAHATQGLFDPTVQPLWQLWHQAALQHQRPAAAAWRTCKALVDWRAIDVQAHRIAFNRPGMAITLNGIAQGLAADLAAAALRSMNIEHALLQTGEWMPMGQPAADSSWRLGIADPRQADAVVATLIADGRAIACSSDDKMSFSADRRDHHILDPRTGRSPTQLSTVVVVAPSCALADALTKPLMMGSAADALAMAKQWGVDVLTIDKAGIVVASDALKVAPRAVR